MTLNQKLKTRVIRLLRNVGLICKKTNVPKHRLRISKTVYHDKTIVHPRVITKVPENKNSFESELHVYNQLKESFNKKIYNKQ